MTGTFVTFAQGVLVDRSAFVCSTNPRIFVDHERRTFVPTWVIFSNGLFGLSITVTVAKAALLFVDTSASVMATFATLLNTPKRWGTRSEEHTSELQSRFGI